VSPRPGSQSRSRGHKYRGAGSWVHLGPTVREILTEMRANAVEFAVADVETTGLFPGGHDRIIEIAIVRTTWTGEVLDEYVTLVNPQRDVGSTSIHGITAGEIARAPVFEEIAGDVTDRLSGAVLAGHGIEFDLRFIDAELARLHASLGSPASVCTLSLSGLLNPPPPSGRLASCCAAASVRHDAAHSALGDAHAAAKLLSAIIRTAHCSSLEDLDCSGEVLAPVAFPELKRSGLVYTRQSAAVAARETETYLSRLVARLPLTPSSVMNADVRGEAILAYLDLLDRALEDRFIFAAEAQALVDLAREWGVSSETVGDAHRMYLDALARAAVADGVVSNAERKDLLAVARWLGLGEGDMELALSEAHATRTAAEIPAQPPRIGAGGMSGKSVCFTGEMGCTIRGLPITREMAEELAESAGLAVKGGVSRNLDLLVCADPLSQSGKAKKAREHGIRVVAEVAFWQMIGVSVD